MLCVECVHVVVQVCVYVVVQVSYVLQHVLRTCERLWFVECNSVEVKLFFASVVDGVILWIACTS